jgi:signal transduction histidine kinase
MYFFDICETSGTFLLSLVNDTLDYGQLSAGQLTFNFEQVNIRELCQDVSKLIAVQLRLKKEIELIMVVQNNVPITFYSDYQRLKQILINLLRNSVKFTSKGKIMITVRAVIMIEKTHTKGEKS